MKQSRIKVVAFDRNRIITETMRMLEFATITESKVSYAARSLSFRRIRCQKQHFKRHDTDSQTHVRQIKG